MSTVPTTAAPVGDTERVYRHIRRGIIEGTYPPGTRLIEAQVSAAVEVSRTPVREAIRRLDSEGLVVSERNRGARVRSLRHDDIVDLYDVRARLEAYGAELAAERADDADRAELLAAADAFDRLAAEGRDPSDIAQTRELEDANRAFHQTLLAASRHARLPALVSGAVDSPLVFQALHRFAPAELERSALFHRLIADAIVARDGARAGRLMTEHILQGRDALLSAIAEADGEDRWLRAVHNDDSDRQEHR